MPQTGCQKSGSVIIDDHRMIDNFIFPVAVNVRHADRVPAHSRIRIRSIDGIEYPSLCELPVSPIPCGENRSSVITATHYDARTNSVEVGYCRQKTVNAVARAVVVTVTAEAAPTVQRITTRSIIGGRPRNDSLCNKDHKT